MELNVQKELEALGKCEQGIVRFTPQHTAPRILCANCGNSMISNGVAICSDCIRLSVDITKDIQKSGTLTFCKNCGRLLNPPNQWIHAPPESRELLASILKRLRGLSKMRLIDARFIWTEPHSRRLKVKITVEGEAKEYQNTLVQQSFEVEFVENPSQCPACAKSYTANTWVASIQIRQRVEHKRTIFYLEQLILKHKAHEHTVSIQESKQGLDFFYNDRKHAVKMVDFLQHIIPIRVKRSEEFISQDTHTSKKTYKFTFNVDIVPISRDDLCVLPKQVATSLGFTSNNPGSNTNQVVLCRRIANSIHFIDTTTLKLAELSSANYWRNPFPFLETTKNLTHYMVLDVEPLGVENKAEGNLVLADITIIKLKDTNGRNHDNDEETTGGDIQEYIVRSHLGGILYPGDTVLGYHLENTNWNNEIWENEVKKESIQSVILVKKYFDKSKNKRKNQKRRRNWKLKRMAVEYNEQADAEFADLEEPKKKGTKVYTKRLQMDSKAERDYEEFLDEIEQDPMLREQVNIFAKKKPAPGEEEEDDDEEDEDDYDDDDSLPEIDIAGLKIDDSDEEDEE